MIPALCQKIAYALILLGRTAGHMQENDILLPRTGRTVVHLSFRNIRIKPSHCASVRNRSTSVQMISGASTTMK